MSTRLPNDYGYVMGVGLGFYLLQSAGLSAAVVMARRRAGISPPTMYPRDSEIEALGLTPTEVEEYTCVQRAHQNGMEFTHIYLPMLLVSGVTNPILAASAGLVTLIGRIVSAVGYCGGPKGRHLGGFFHVGELVTLVLVGKTAWNLVRGNLSNSK